MPIVQSPFVLWTCVAYLAACLAIGYWSWRRTENAKDFFVAGKSLSIVVMIVAANTSIISGFAFIGGPGAVYASGSSSMWIACAVIGGPVGLILVGKRLALLAEVREIYTLPDVVEARFGGRWPRAAMAMALLVGVVGYLGTQVLALGVAMSAMFDISLASSMAIGLAVLAVYSVAGGMLAAVYTDLLQGALMLAAALAICYYALEAAGGLAQMTTTLQEMDPDYLSAWGTMGPLGAVSWHFLAVLGIAGQPHVISKYLMLRDVRSMKWAQALSISTFLPVTFIWVGVGLAMRYLVEAGVEAPLASADLATPMFLLHHTPPVVAGIALAGLLGAIMSTSDTFLNLGAAAAVRDIPRAFLGRGVERELFWSRMATVALLAVSALFAYYMGSLTALLGTFAAGTFAAAIAPTMALGLNWKRASAAACVSSIAVSIVLNLSLELLSRNGIQVLPPGLFVGAVSILSSFVVFIGVSLLTGDPQGKDLAADIAAVMEA